MVHGGRATLLLAGLVGIAPGAPGQEPAAFTGYVTLASDYRNRGLSHADGGALQLGLDYRHRSGVFAGAWATNVEYASDEERPSPRQTERAYYLGYDWQRGDWRLTASWSGYDYPGARIDYDYGEVGGHVAYRDRLFFGAAYTRNFYGRGVAARTDELAMAWPLAWNTELGATLGRVHYDRVPNGAYTYWNVGASKVVRRVAVDLRYHDASFEQSSYFGSAAADRWVLSATYGIQPRR